MVALVLLLACGTPDAPEPEASAGADVATVLAKADAHDGESDQVVHECAGCALGMTGDPAHATKHAGFELHFCSEGCQSRFVADPAAGLARLAGVVD
ncbi:MAG: hypothetical protein ACI8PZ_002126 [Myxococcota bacterium]|jgi:hypothetical protein